MQNSLQDLFNIINHIDTSVFCIHEMHDTTYIWYPRIGSLNNTRKTLIRGHDFMRPK
jgi:hypothetical protein